MSITVTARPCVSTLPDEWSPVPQGDAPVRCFERRDEPWRVRG